MRILVVDDERNIRESLSKILALEGMETVAAADGREALAAMADEAFDAVVTDLRMPGMGGQELLERLRDSGSRCPVVMISALGDIADAVKALKTGAVDYLLKPFDPEELVLKLRAAVGNRRRDDLLEAGRRAAAVPSGFVGTSRKAEELRRSIAKIAGTDATVLITGESGSGKEVVAREIHAASPRATEPFVAVNVGGIHENLIESELFGHEKGAFTGADARRIGMFELAGSGSLFLDEIGEMPPRLQVKLLRVLQEKKIRRLGGAVDIPVSARILSATNRELEAAVADGSFREDLYYRLDVVRVEVPPLRDRPGDVPVLAGFILERVRARMGGKPAALGRDALEALSGYPFPGNVRELENIIERAVIYAEDGEIRAADLGLPSRPAARSAGAPSGFPAAPAAKATPAQAIGARAPMSRPPEPRPETPAAPRAAANGPAEAPASLGELEKAAVVSALARHGGNRTKAAQELGMGRRTLLYKIKEWGL